MELIKKYMPGLSPEQEAQFSALQNLYSEWNAAINVISRKDIDYLYERHVLHSLGIAMVIKIAAGSQVLDVGTGGGFPGIPLAILFPDVDFHLVDSIGKKIKVVNAVAEALDLKNVTTSNCRAESITGKYDFIVSRAVTSLPEFTAWTKKNIAKPSKNPLHNGILYLKGGDLTTELKESGGKYQIYKLSRYFKEPFFETKSVVHLWY
ncbi:MAG: 16S rRNA (guanine(527)-N(7))-methyltransferase RsmG [Bacteroidetes bacterium HGW-Bacteroidetes-9]|jgi:16S rRNA (guanine527-N7)-methyltransferase|nr:MAG: 16S rRNA (guanine(527)-N(7))-methyltransferase RsmG [Bacteroidetes bacterium HGW-Bacteroidetes-9]